MHFSRANKEGRKQERNKNAKEEELRNKTKRREWKTVHGKEKWEKNEQRGRTRSPMRGRRWKENKNMLRRKDSPLPLFAPSCNTVVLKLYNLTNDDASLLFLSHPPLVVVDPLYFSPQF